MSEVVTPQERGSEGDPGPGARRRRAPRLAAVVALVALAFGGWALWQKVVGPDRLAAGSGLPAHHRVAAGDLLLDQVLGPYRYRVADRSTPALEVGLDNLGGGCEPLVQVPTVVSQTPTAVEVVVGVYTPRSLVLRACTHTSSAGAATMVWVALPLDAPVGDRAVLDGTTHRAAVPDDPSTIPPP